MLFPDHLVVVRGGGDLATGVAYRLHHAGFPILILELAQPLAVRRTVALSSAVLEGHIRVEDITARRVESVDEARHTATSGEIPVLISPELPEVARSAVIDARMAKRNIDTTLTDAPLVVGLGPGFVAGLDCHAAIETVRGHQLGRVLWSGPTAPNTGVPGTVGGRSADRVLRARTSGIVEWEVAIGEIVDSGQLLGRIGDSPIAAAISGVVRGLLTPGLDVASGTKIGDIDPRGDPSACSEISDKALAIGGGAVEAVLTWLTR